MLKGAICAKKCICSHFLLCLWRHTFLKIFAPSFCTMSMENKNDPSSEGGPLTWWHYIFLGLASSSTLSFARPYWALGIRAFTWKRRRNLDHLGRRNVNSNLIEDVGLVTGNSTTPASLFCPFFLGFESISNICRKKYIHSPQERTLLLHLHFFFILPSFLFC